MKIKIIYISVVFLLCASGCKKFLETKPTDFSVPEQYYSTEGELNDALAGCYAALATDGTYSLNWSAFLPYADDLSYYGANTPSTPNPMAYDHAANHTYFENSWREFYAGINRTNYLLKNINKPAMDENKRNVIKGQALFIRAFCYFQLVSSWNDVPLILEPVEDPSKVLIAKTPALQVYEQIIKDMKEALPLVNDYATNGGPVKIGKTTVQAALARVYLKMAGAPMNDVAKYTDARAWADSVIQSGVHNLNPSYSQIFINESADLYDNTTKEVLWEIEFYGNNTGALRIGGRFGSYLAANSTDKDAGYGYARATASGYLYKLYAGAADLRRDWNIAPYLLAAGHVEVMKSSNDIYTRGPGKWRRKYETVLPKNTDYTPTNFPVFRYSDVLLMFAETENYLAGPTGRAYDAVNMVRRRGYGMPIGISDTSISVLNSFTLSTTGNTGYSKTATVIPVTLSGGGGTGATANATVSTSTGKVTSVNILTPGTGYTSAPTVTIGAAWTATTIYTVGAQVFNGNNLYTVTTAGTSTTKAPTNTSGASSAAETGAVFTYAGAKATATASIASFSIDAPAGMSKESFQKYIMDERGRELCFEGNRKFDLIRWNVFLSQMKITGDDLKANGGTANQWKARPFNNVSEKHLLYPIPTREITLNSALEQNPLWK